MLGVILSLDATNTVNEWFLLHVACRGGAGMWGVVLSVILFFWMRAFVLKVVFFF